MKRIKLVLEDETEFEGYAFGAEISSAGEVVFNTGMAGYPESLTDPSYAGQILVLTYPLIGNYGVSGDKREEGLKKFFESDNIHVKGLVVTEHSKEFSHWNAEKSLSDWLKEHDVPGITGIDTRALTQKLREKGVMLGKIIHDEVVGFYDPNKEHIVETVSVPYPVVYGRGRKKVVLIDCGVKNNIIRCLVKRKVTVTRVPWDFDFFKLQFDGVVISNGPGDPKMCKATIAHVKKAMQHKIPVFGICLGNQILALAAGGDTYKLKYGHRGQNQPCVQAGTKQCYITSQNHGFAVDKKTLPNGWEEWFYNANDGTNEGIIHKSGLFRTIQWHPEASPGPEGTAWLFDEFIRMMGEG